MENNQYLFLEAYNKNLFIKEVQEKLKAVIESTIQGNFILDLKNNTVDSVVPIDLELNIKRYLELIEHRRNQLAEHYNIKVIKYAGLEI